jgi:hypothetical protein
MPLYIGIESDRIRIYQKTVTDSSINFIILDEFSHNFGPYICTKPYGMYRTRLILAKMERDAKIHNLIEQRIDNLYQKGLIETKTFKIGGDFLGDSSIL